jgi:two-component system, NarL family, response regulator DesR
LIRIALGQQGNLVRGALANLLSAEDDLQVIAELAELDELFMVAARVRPNVVVLHHTLAGPLPISDACAKLCESLPDCAVLALLDRRASTMMLGTLADLVPRVGMLAEEATPVELIDGVRRIAGGGPVLDARLTVVALTSGNNPLTERERDVLRRAADGLPVKEIAAELCLSVGTVRNYLSSCITKTHARTRIEAIRIAHDAGWI